MILDWQHDDIPHDSYDVIDAQTGESLKGMTIWYADDERGLIRRYAKDSTGALILNGRGDAAVSIEEHRAIRIVAKGASRPAKAETRRDRPPLF